MYYGLKKQSVCGILSPQKRPSFDMSRITARILRHRGESIVVGITLTWALSLTHLLAPWAQHVTNSSPSKWEHNLPHRLFQGSSEIIHAKWLVQCQSLHGTTLLKNSNDNKTQELLHTKHFITNKTQAGPTITGSQILRELHKSSNSHPAPLPAFSSPWPTFTHTDRPYR